MTPNSVRPLPDPEIALRESRDFILGSRLARRALCSSVPNLALFVHDLIEAVHRLVQSCHLPEFTDHGLPHLCSLIDRISRWELPISPPRSLLCDNISSDEAGTLLIGTLIHDIGMLSQNPIDLPDGATHLQSKASWPDIASWVRQTHVDRMDKLVRRILFNAGYDGFLVGEMFINAAEVAKSHQRWPWEWRGDWTKAPRLRGLAALIAVVDLLDEDSARCDTTTLLEHREGNELNRAHWLRHALTANRILVNNGRIRIEMIRPPNTGRVLKPVFSALRNHFRLVALYESDLLALNAPITNVDIEPSTGVPDREAPELSGWDRIRGFSTENALCFQLMRTFMSPVLKDARRCDAETIRGLRVASLEDVDLALLEACEGAAEPRTEVEKTFAALAIRG